jgi:hypothetical protein
VLCYFFRVSHRPLGKNSKIALFHICRPHNNNAHLLGIVSYHANVLKSRQLLLVVLLAAAGCRGTSVDCGPIEASNRVTIHADGRLPDREVTASRQIASLVAFANSRRSCSKPTTYTMPAPRTSVTFYRDSTFLGALGAGSNFFSVACPKGNGIRPASSDELSSFAQLINDLN